MAQWVVLQLISKVCAGEKGYKGRGAQEGGFVAPRGNREATSGNLGRSLTGGKEEEATKRESHSVGVRGMW